jgi:hypothetical protein
MVANPTGAMVFHWSLAWWWDNTKNLDELIHNPKKFVWVFKYILYKMLRESTEIWNFYLGVVCITDSALLQEKQATKQYFLDEWLFTLYITLLFVTVRVLLKSIRKLDCSFYFMAQNT